MSVPVTGAIILVVAAWFFLFSPRLLYAALIISIPFSATAVVNFGWGGSEFGGADKSLMAWQLLAALWVAREAFSGVPQWHRKGWFLTRRSRLALFFFVAALIASWSVPLLLNGTSWLPYWKTAALGGASGIETVALRFSSYNLTQSAYLALGVLVIVFIAAENCQPAKLLRTLSLYLKSCTFVAAWGLIQLWCIITGTAYPWQVFNTSRSLTAVLGHKQHLLAGSFDLGRVSSVALEPSMFAEELLFAFAILVMCLGTRDSILPSLWNRLALLLVSAALLASTSTTAYTGMLVALILASVTLARSGSRQWRRYPAIAGLCVAAIVALSTCVPLIHDTVKAAFVTKFENGRGGTGNERLSADILAAKIFLQHPILGAGWHEVDCYDIFLLLLGNVGMVGFVAFASFLLPVMRRLWRLTKLQYFPAMLLLPAVGLSLFLAEGAGFSLIPVNWLALGLAAAAATGAGVKLLTALKVNRGGNITRRPRFRATDGPAIIPPAV